MLALGRALKIWEEDVSYRILRVKATFVTITVHFIVLSNTKLCSKFLIPGLQLASYVWLQPFCNLQLNQNAWPNVDIKQWRRLRSAIKIQVEVYPDPCLVVQLVADETRLIHYYVKANKGWLLRLEYIEVILMKYI